MSYDSSNLTTPDIKWLGVRPSDLDRFNIPEQCRLPMTEKASRTVLLTARASEATTKDIETGRLLLQEDFVKANPAWVEELELMLRSKEKAEIRVWPISWTTAMALTRGGRRGTELLRIPVSLGDVLAAQTCDAPCHRW